MLQRSLRITLGSQLDECREEASNNVLQSWPTTSRSASTEEDEHLPDNTSDSTSSAEHKLSCTRQLPAEGSLASRVSCLLAELPSPDALEELAELTLQDGVANELREQGGVAMLVRASRGACETQDDRIIALAAAVIANCAGQSMRGTRTCQYQFGEGVELQVSLMSG